MSRETSSTKGTKGKNLFFRPSLTLEKNIRNEAKEKYDGNVSMTIHKRLSASYAKDKQ